MSPADGSGAREAASAGAPATAARPAPARATVPLGWKDKKALLKVGYGCNENCTFCHTADVRHVDGSSEYVVRKIHRAHELGHGMVVFSGGEPTIRPEIFEWATLVASLGLDVGLVTNGLLLAYPDVLERLIARRLRYVYMSLHGVGRIHDRLVRTDDASVAAFRAVANLSGRGLDLTINCVVTPQNVEHLEPLVDALIAYPDLRLKFSMVHPKGGAERLFDTVTARVSEVAPAVVRAIRHGQALVRARGASGPSFGHDGIPHCHLPGLEHLYDDLKTHRYATMVDIGEGDYCPIDEKLSVQPEETCGGCSRRGACPGLFKGYLQRFGAGEITPPPPVPRSNSFTWAFQALVEASAPSAFCPLRDGALGVLPWDASRELFVRNRLPDGGYRIARFRTDTRDFSDAELFETKHALGQAYLDVSRKAAPDDFATDLRPLVRSALCEGCEHRAGCTGMWEPALSEDPFTRDDAAVRAVIAALAGDVLDLGCGEGPYDDVLGPAAKAGRVRYLGVDPHADLVALGARRPWAELMAGDAESVPLERTFDHVLVLRSWNHLREPAAVVRRVLAALRPGGTFLVVDNVAFGLARTRTQTTRAERGPAGFEHYRNDDAARAARTIEQAAEGALGLVERLDVAPGTANQWLLRYRKA